MNRRTLHIILIALLVATTGCAALRTEPEAPAVIEISAPDTDGLADSVIAYVLAWHPTSEYAVNRTPFNSAVTLSFTYRTPTPDPQTLQTKLETLHHDIVFSKK